MCSNVLNRDARRLRAVCRCGWFGVFVVFFFLAGRASQAQMPPVEWVELTPEEEARVFLGVGIEPERRVRGFREGLPERVTLRDSMSPVKSQGNRGTCSAFATVALLEAFSSDIISEQCLVHDMGSGDPGTIPKRLDWAMRHPLYRQDDCLYKPGEEDATTIPADLHNKERLFLRGDITDSYHHNGDLVSYVRHSLAQNRPVGVAVLIAGVGWGRGIHVEKKICPGYQINCLDQKRCR